jgi:hypothetical protein
MAQDFMNALQAMSNSAAGTVSGPVDGIAWLLRKAGVPVPQNALGGSDWMRSQGLMAPVEQGVGQVLGETAGLLSPALVAAKAPQIAGGLLQAGRNLAAAPTITGPAAAQRGIVPASFVREQGGKASLPADDLFAQAVANTPGAAIDADGLLMRLQRNQRPEQGMMPSTRGGVFYLPEGAAQAKHYSTGKNGYGGGERISGETLIQNPLFVKGATGGKAPEAAVDQLLGKGSYQTIRTEAIQALGGYGASRSDKVAGVRSFLAKHAPELQDQADYIVRNSASGNQLPYALQEAAVGSAVRRAGHDAVLGYSKQKTGAPFLSEVFDVREQVYPDKFGGFGVWGE